MIRPLYETTYSQVESELAWFIEILKRENVTSFLEVGSRYGGSLWRIAQEALPKGAKIVSCDSGKGMGGRKPGAADSLQACIRLLQRDGYDAHLVVGDSQTPSIIKEVYKFAPFDAIFIDADHELRGVTLDWKNYSQMVKKDGIVAFHDIGWVLPENYLNSKKVEVPEFWAGVKDSYRSEECIDRSTGVTMGIGVLWPTHAT